MNEFTRAQKAKLLTLLENAWERREKLIFPNGQINLAQHSFYNNLRNKMARTKLPFPCLVIVKELAMNVAEGFIEENDLECLQDHVKRKVLDVVKIYINKIGVQRCPGFDLRVRKEITCTF